MIILNKAMRHHASRELVALSDYPPLPSDLWELLDNGFSEKNGCYFFKKFLPKVGNVNVETIYKMCGDLIGYEISINTFHINDFSESLTLSMGLSFSREFTKCWSAWSTVPCKLVLSSIIGEFGEDTTFRFYVPREGEIYMDFADLDSFEESILAVDVFPGNDTAALDLGKIKNMLKLLKK